MTLFSSEPYRQMADALVKAQRLTPGTFQVRRFENHELYVSIHTGVTNERCIILGSVSPPDQHLLSTLLLAHTLKKEGAAEVIAVIPYLAYARHDKEKAGESLATAWIGALSRASGIDQLITIDIHSERSKNLFPIPVISLSPARIFAEALKQYGFQNATIVAPDEGAIMRCKAVQQMAGMRLSDVPFLRKRRTSSGVVHSGHLADVGWKVVLVDDILDTGGTLVSACEKLVQAGVEELGIMITHGLFTGEKWKELWRFGVKQIFCTDSVPPGSCVEDKIVRLSVLPLLQEQMAERAAAISLT
jgi:ribose-phosphate pyrophosphokinase